MQTVLLLFALGAGGGEPAKVEAPVACESCDNLGTCNSCRASRIDRRRRRRATSTWGMMPQTCYDPSYGCYPGSRYMTRYPAFHGSYYRRPYNYRHAFTYPWHAKKHEPTSMFSYNVEAEQVEEVEESSIPIPPPQANRVRATSTRR